MASSKSSLVPESLYALKATPASLSDFSASRNGKNFLTMKQAHCVIVDLGRGITHPLERIEVTYQEDNGNDQEGSVGFSIQGKERHTTDFLGL